MKKLFSALLIITTLSIFVPAQMQPEAFINPKISNSYIEKAASQKEEKKEAAAVADKLFEAMRAKNADAIRAVFIPEGQLVAVDKPRNGQGLSTRRVFTADAFAKAISEGKGDFIEKMPEKKVEISGDFALVYGRYTFYVGDKFSHCGVNSFQLVKTEAGWKISNAASTLEFNCDQSKK